MTTAAKFSATRPPTKSTSKRGTSLFKSSALANTQPQNTKDSIIKRAGPRSQNLTWYLPSAASGVRRLPDERLMKFPPNLSETTKLSNRLDQMCLHKIASHAQKVEAVIFG